MEPATATIAALEQPLDSVAPATRVDDRTRVLKEGDTFALLDRFGDIAAEGPGEFGVYHQGTRFLSRLVLTINGQRPLFLSSAVNIDNSAVVVNLANPDLGFVNGVRIRRGTLHLSREMVLWDGVLYERLRFANYGTQRLDVRVALALAADFADMFEVRGTRRARRGELLPPDLRDGVMVLRYRGLDGVRRDTRIVCMPPASSSDSSAVNIDLSLDARATAVYRLAASCEIDRSEPRPILAFAEAEALAASAMREWSSHDCVVESSNDQFNEWLAQSSADLRLLLSKTPHGRYPYAGVPWFSTPFGRDGIITALETLWLNADMGRGVLSVLAATQAQTVNPIQDAEPGKILHEARQGEMATLGEVPFGRYYGSVDATPLFVMLAGAYYRRTGDRGFIEELWPAITGALEWLETYGDRDGDGFVEYMRMTDTGLVNQGWKDSHDSVFHDDGRQAEGPIALCEVQAYTYAALRAGSRLAALLGQEELAGSLLRRANRLRRRFERAFWLDDLKTYAIALDGAKQPCRVRSSNAGHCLYTGIAAMERARFLCHELLSEPMFSGWGIRTVARDEARYNPMSYHNGSVWPHDNALIAAGLARYGLRRAVLEITGAMFDAARFFDLNRLPELFCGFERRPGQGPTLYPVACSPQAWAAAAPFLLIQSCLGLTISAVNRRVTFNRPQLPPFLRRLTLRGLRVADDEIDLVLERHASDVAVHLERRSGSVDVHVIS